MATSQPRNGIYEIYVYENAVVGVDALFGTAQFNLSRFGITGDDDTPITYLEGWSYLSFTQKNNDAWYHQIRFDLNEDSPMLSILRGLKDPDYIIEIWRTDTLTGDKRVVYHGLNQTVVDQVGASGKIIITMYGVGLTDLLKRRIVVPPAGEETVYIGEPASEAIESYVEYYGAAALPDDRGIPGLWVQRASPSFGNFAEYEARYVNLFTVVSRLAEQGEVDFGIVMESEVGRFRFEVRELWGDSRVIGNTAGNDPIIFSIEIGNMAIPIYSVNASAEDTALFVGGQGQGTARLVLERVNASRIALSPWNRKEAFVDARHLEKASAVSAFGYAELEKRAVRKELTFNVINTVGYGWPVDWGMGDTVTAIYEGLRFDKKIIEVSVAVSSSGEGHTENINVELEDI